MTFRSKATVLLPLLLVLGCTFDPDNIRARTVSFPEIASTTTPSPVVSSVTSPVPSQSASAPPEPLPGSPPPVPCNDLVPCGESNSKFFPVGTRWEYDLSTFNIDYGDTGVVTMEVANQFETLVTIRVVEMNRSNIVIDEREVKVLATDSTPYAAIVRKTKASLTNYQPMRTTQEQVTVPAGTFTATKLVYEATDGDGDDTSTLSIWFVPEVGLVKSYDEKITIINEGRVLRARSSRELKLRAWTKK